MRARKIGCKLCNRRRRLKKVATLGGGHTSQLYALRQAIAKAVVAYVAKYEDAASALEVRKVLVAYDRSLLVADPRRCEPKKFGPSCPAHVPARPGLSC